MGIKVASLFAAIGADTAGLERGLKSTKTGLQKAGGSLKSFGVAAGVAFAAAGAAAYGLKKAMEFGKEQAGLEFTRDKFDNLSKSIGTTADTLLNELRDATGGLVSDMELVTSATGFMELGLVKTKDEAVRLTKVAGQLGMDMNQLTLTLTNQTTHRFDALGVSVDGFKERVDELKKSGMNANDAFNEAFLRQAEEQIEKVGDVADSSMSSFMKLETEFSNLADTSKRKLLPPLEKVAGALSEIISLTNTNQGIVDAMDNALANHTITQDEYNNILGRGRGYLTDYAAATDLLAIASERNNEFTSAAAIASQRQAMASRTVTGAMTSERVAANDLGGAKEDLIPGSEAWLEQQELEKKAMDLVTEALKAQAAAAFETANQFLDLGFGYSSMTDAELAEAALKSLRIEMGKDNDMTEDEIAKLEELALALGVADSSAWLFADNIGILTRALGDGTIATEDADAATADFNQGIKDGTLDVADWLEKWKDTSSAADEFKAGMDDMITGGLDPLEEGLEAVGGPDGIAKTTETAMVVMADTMMGSTVAGKMNTFSEDVIGGLTASFKNLWEKAGMAAGAVGAVGAALKLLDGTSADTYVYVHTIGGGRAPDGGAIPVPDDDDPLLWKASGGPVLGGNSYIVGEMGPEIFSPGVNGQIIPNSDMGGGGDLVAEIRGLRRDLPRVMRDAVLMAV
jgi:hypothetical protein